MLLEFGLVGLAVLALPLLGRQGNGPRRAALVALLVGGCLDYLLWSPQIAAMTGLVVGLAAAPPEDGE